MLGSFFHALDSNGLFLVPLKNWEEQTSNPPDISKLTKPNQYEKAFSGTKRFALFFKLFFSFKAGKEDEVAEGT